MSGRRHARRALARGVIAAMAMTGMRTFTKGIGLIERVPPERIAEEGTPELLARIPPEHRDEALELAHWAYGAGGGLMFELLPKPLRQARWSGPVYGVIVWLFFELVLDPILRLRVQRRRPVGERLALAADHVLYGVVVAGSAFPLEEH